MSEFWLWLILRALDGVSFGLVFIAVIAIFGFVYWLIDRGRA